MVLLVALSSGQSPLVVALQQFEGSLLGGGAGIAGAEAAAAAGGTEAGRRLGLSQPLAVRHPAKEEGRETLSAPIAISCAPHCPSRAQPSTWWVGDHGLDLEQQGLEGVGGGEQRLSWMLASTKPMAYFMQVWAINGGSYEDSWGKAVAMVAFSGGRQGGWVRACWKRRPAHAVQRAGLPRLAAQPCHLAAVPPTAPLSPGLSAHPLCSYPDVCLHRAALQHHKEDCV